jgi:hypothetical protein
MKIGHGNIYDSYRELVIHSENISWSRFNNLLVINSILVVAWATLFSQGTSISAQVVMTAISFLGIFTGIAWGDLGKRSRRYIDRYKEKLRAIEEHHDKAGWWENDIPIPITDRPFQIQVAPKCFSSSTFLLIWTPRFFALMNAVLLFATWWRC